MTSQAIYSLVGLTATVLVLCGVLAFATARLVRASREARGIGRPVRADAESVMSAAAEALERSGIAGQSAALESARAAWHRELARLIAEEVRACARRSRDASSRGAGIVCDVDALERLADAAERIVAPAPAATPADLRPLVEHGARAGRSAARRQGGDLLVDGSFPALLCDAPLITSAFSALVARALASCEAAGVAPVIAITGRTDDAGHRHVITIGDNGLPPPGSEATADGPVALASRGPADDLEGSLIRRVFAHSHATTTIGVSEMGGTLVALTFQS
jgi:hypothetical protein